MLFPTMDLLLTCIKLQNGWLRLYITKITISYQQNGGFMHYLFEDQLLLYCKDGGMLDVSFFNFLFNLDKIAIGLKKA